MKRALRWYYASILSTLALFAGVAILGATTAGDWSWNVHRGVVLLLAVLSGLAAWGTAVGIASVHKVAWPLGILVAGVVVATAIFFALTRQGLG